jgi:hypothetical protein
MKLKTFSKFFKEMNEISLFRYFADTVFFKEIREFIICQNKADFLLSEFL